MKTDQKVKLFIMIMLLTIWMVGFGEDIFADQKKSNNPSQRQKKGRASKKKLFAERGAYAIRKAIQAALREEARAKTIAEKSSKLRQLCLLYLEVVVHPKLHKTERNKQLNRLRSRLSRVSRELKKKIKQHRPIPERTTLAKSISSSSAKVVAQGGRAQQDLAQELIELIQQTIAPKSWKVNGGNGVIVYYAPRQALVVSASLENHGNVAGLVKVLRKVGN